jgi:hypothetical protein
MIIVQHSVVKLPCTLLGRWTKSEQSIAASWVSASLRFRCVARRLAVLPGPASKRYDEERAKMGIKMVLVCLKEDGTASTFETDLQAGKETILFEGAAVKDIEVEIKLVDWSATLEIQSFSITDVCDMFGNRPSSLI